mmetsp:Transcript_15876/g.26578  ORF Transcript_15876/g.26578 Transcript_15876/m.26578 type:complete len:234 (+) Transcript_15876:355-1056(+)
MTRQALRSILDIHAVTLVHRQNTLHFIQQMRGGSTYHGAGMRVKLAPIQATQHAAGLRHKQPPGGVIPGFPSITCHPTIHSINSSTCQESQIQHPRAILPQSVWVAVEHIVQTMTCSRNPLAIANIAKLMHNYGILNSPRVGHTETLAIQVSPLPSDCSIDLSQAWGMHDPHDWHFIDHQANRDACQGIRMNKVGGAIYRVDNPSWLVGKGRNFTTTSAGLFTDELMVRKAFP